MNILDGKLVSKKIKEEIKKEVSALSKKPCLLVILVGDDQASQIYVSSKEKACKRVGMESKTIVLEENISLFSKALTNVFLLCMKAYFIILNINSSFVTCTSSVIPRTSAFLSNLMA